MESPVDDTLHALEQSALQELQQATSEPQLIQIRARYLGKKGELTAQLKTLGQLSLEERRTFGARLNEVKTRLEQAADDRLTALKSLALASLATNRPDLTLPGRPTRQGRLHPVYQILEEVEDVFIRLGFDLCEGPDIEDDWHNFGALNIPEGHPAREMQDTFYLEKGLVLRTHTSPVQIRTMLAQKPPVRMIAPGTVYRSDFDATHSPMFHQIEGLLVDEQVSLAELKGILLQFVRCLFGPSVDIRFRASFFPFTEPSAEIDMLCFQCLGKGCRLCKDTGWIEIGGSGMVNPAVFQAIGSPDYDPVRIKGFAFGMGIERIAMLKLGINDIRYLYDNDLRLLHQF